MTACEASANSAPFTPTPAQRLAPEPPEPSRWRALWSSDRMAKILCAGFGFLLFVSLARTLRMPNGYAKGHWLHNYKHGFVPRGLVGELLYPIMQNKGPQELDGIIAFFSWGILAALMGLFVHGAWILLKPEKVPWRRGLLVLLLALFGSSPFVVMAGHLSGYFDQIIQLLAFLALMAAVRRRFWLSGVVCTVAILIHEMFIVTAMPAVFFATLLFTQGQSPRDRGRALAGLLVLPVICALIIMGKGLGTSDVSGLTADIERYGVMDTPDVATVHLSQGFSSILGEMIRTTFIRMGRIDGLRAISPGLSGILICALMMRFPRPARWLRVLLVLTSLAPLLMLLTVWNGDTGRMASTTLFCAFCSAVALGYWSQAKAKAPQEEPELAQPWPAWLWGRTPGNRALIYGMAWAGAAIVFVWHVARYTHLMDYEIDRQTMLSVRKLRSAPGYRCDQLMFKNSNFELGTLEGWHQSGSAFASQPVDRQPAVWFRRPWNEGKHWIGTYDKRSLLGRPLQQGDQLMGTLTSLPFIITRPYMTFLIGGGSRMEKTYVVLEVEGKEVYRATGRQSSRMRTVIWELHKYIGRSATIRIADQDPGGWGHINTDGFCYLDTTRQSVAALRARARRSTKPKSQPRVVPSALKPGAKDKKPDKNKQDKAKQDKNKPPGKGAAAVEKVKVKVTPKTTQPSLDLGASSASPAQGVKTRPSAGLHPGLPPGKEALPSQPAPAGKPALPPGKEALPSKPAPAGKQALPPGKEALPSKPAPAGKPALPPGKEALPSRPEAPAKPVQPANKEAASDAARPPAEPQPRVPDKAAPDQAQPPAAQKAPPDKGADKPAANKPHRGSAQAARPQGQASKQAEGQTPEPPAKPEKAAGADQESG